MSLGTRIYEQRTAHGLSQTDLAGLLEVSRQSISKWETDASVPELDKLVKMCQLFEVSMDQLVLGKEPVRPDPAVQPVPAARTLAAPQSIIGLALIALGLFLFLLLTDNFGADSNSMLLALPFLVLGTLCLILRDERLLLGFGWVLWLFYQHLLRSNYIYSWEIPELLFGYDAFQDSIAAFLALLAFAGFWALFFLTIRAFAPKEDKPSGGRRS